MVDGINISSPPLPGTAEKREAVSKAPVVSGTSQAKTAEVTIQAKANGPEGVSSSIAKSVDQRVSALISGNTSEFLQAAEKFIDASLPNKPPGTKLRIDLDSDSGRFVYKGVDIKTGDVVIQFPSEDILKLIAFNRERDGVEGIVVDEEA